MLFIRGQASYIKKLWNGECFLYDTESEYKHNIQAEQLAGQWYANMTGLGNLVPPEMQRKALKKVFDFNVMKFSNGEMGAVSGLTADGSIIRKNDNQQVGEVWTGATFSIAALMLSDGMKDEAYRTAWGEVYDPKGYTKEQFETWTTSSDIALIKSMGFDHIRLSVNPQPMLNYDHPEEISAQYLGYLDAAVKMILDQGLTVVLDLQPESAFKARLAKEDVFVQRFGDFWRALAKHYSSWDSERLFLEDPERARGN